jgi:Protein of unknown function (DUF3810)
VRWRIAAVAAAAAAALLPTPPSFVERFYSTAVYPPWQRIVTGASNVTAVALFDLLVVGVAGAWLVLAAAQIARRRVRALLPIAVRTVVWSAVGYLAFLACWGLNYRRVRLVDRLAFDASRVSADAVRTLARVVVDAANRSYEPAHAAAEPALKRVDPALAAAFEAALGAVGIARPIVPGRPKVTWFDWYFRRAGVEGMTDPFFLETLVPSDLTPYERPTTIAHEWAHLAGITDEGEASFVGWLACAGGGAPDKYAAWLFLYEETIFRLTRADRAAIAGALEPGPRQDLQAMAARVERNVSPRVAAVGWQVYDQYLKSNRVEAGVASYSEVLRLVLGTPFNPAMAGAASRP